MCNFADDNTLYACDLDPKTALISLRKDTIRILNWFQTIRSLQIPQNINSCSEGIYTTMKNYL